VTATDRATNEGAATFRLIRDATAPHLTLDVMPGRDGVQVSWEAGDTISGLGTCRLEVDTGDGSPEELSTNCAGTRIYTEAEPGHLYTFRLSATDNVGNAASSEAQAGLPRVVKYFYHGGQRVAMRSGGQVFYLHGDHLGSVSLVTDAGGNEHSRTLFYPYGDTRYTTGDSPTDFGFAGQRAIAGTGLVFMHARYYHAGLARFISADTIVPEPGNPQDLNRFAYTRNNPVLYVDPSGHRAGPPLVDGICAPGTCNSALKAKTTGAVWSASSVEVMSHKEREYHFWKGYTGLFSVVPGMLAPVVAYQNVPKYTDVPKNVDSATVSYIEAVLGAGPSGTGEPLAFEVPPGALYDVNAAGRPVPPLEPLGQIHYSPYVIHIDPTNGGPMAIDTTAFTSGRRTAQGGIRNPKQFWEAWQQKYPQTLSADNQLLVSQDRSPTVDSTWVQYFPEHNPYMFQTLEHHHLDQGPLAIPLPRSAHRIGESFMIWHIVTN
jgi:RHS repeat-associated protein